MSGPVEIIILAGPNGAGKSSFAEKFLTAQMKTYVFLNADVIAKELAQNGLPSGEIDLRAGRALLTQIRSSIAMRDNVIVETTLSSMNWARHLPDWKSAGYSIKLIYLRLPTAESAVQRVNSRVARGGHAIPEPTIRRRFERSLANLNNYKGCVDRWYVYDSIEDAAPILAETGGRNDSRPSS